MWTEALVAFAVLLLAVQFLTQRRPSKFPPGPTGVPLVGYLPFLKFPAYEGMLEISKKYGKISSMFFGNFPVVILNDIDIAKEVFRDERFGRPPVQNFRGENIGEERGILYSDGRVWYEQRRFVLKNLRDLGLGKGQMESLIKEEVDEIISLFKSQTGHPVDILYSFKAAVLNALWHLVSGERYAHDDPKLESSLKLIIDEFYEIDGVLSPLVYFFPWLTYWFPEMTGWSKLKRNTQAMLEFMQAIVDTHKAKLDPDHPNDLVDVYLNEIENTTDPTSSFYKEEGEKNLAMVMFDIFAAGADTTSTTLGFAVLYCIRFPEVQKKAQQEIDDVLGSERMPCLSDRIRLPYMEALITETLRMSSLVPMGGFRSPTETVELHGYVLPKGTVLMGNLWAFHNDPEYWGDPHIFRPERFIGSDGGFQKSERVVPFSTGKRVCPGEGIARDQLFLFLTRMFQQLEFKMDPSEPPPTLEPKQGFFLYPIPYKVIMETRHGK